MIHGKNNMWKFCWIVIVIFHKVHTSELPEVPKDPLWTNLKIEQKRSSVIPSWYDVLVTPQIRKIERENSTKKKTYTNLREAFPLNAELPEVMQKHVVLEAVELDPNSKLKKTSTKMKDLFKNGYLTSKKDIKTSAILGRAEAALEKAKIKEASKNATVMAKEIKSHFLKKQPQNKQPEEIVPLYYPIFRSQENGKKKSRRILQKPETALNDPTKIENLDSEFDVELGFIQSKTDTNNVNTTSVNVDVSEQINNDAKITMKQIITNPTREISRTEVNLDKQPVKKSGRAKTGKFNKNSNVNLANNKEKCISVESSKENNESGKVKESQTNEYQKIENNVRNYVLQAAQNGELKLYTKAVASKPFHKTEKADDERTKANIFKSELMSLANIYQQTNSFQSPKPENNLNHPQINIQIPGLVIGKPNQVYQNQALERPMGKLYQGQGSQNHDPELITGKLNQQTLQRYQSPVPIQLFPQNMPQENLNRIQGDSVNNFDSCNMRLQTNNMLGKVGNAFQENGNVSPVSTVCKPKNLIPNLEYYNVKGNSVQLNVQENNIPGNQVLGKDSPVITVFKPDTVTLRETHGNIMKDVTMTVLVPVYAEKVMTGL